MSITHSVEINAPRKQVFGLYADIASWPEWDSETLAVDLPGLQVGAAGWLKPRQGPRATIRVAEVMEDSSFTVEGRLPLCRMHFGHELEDDGNRTIATHWVRFTGLLAPLFRRLIGTGIDRTLPQTLAGLKRVSEEKSTHG
ncbi:MAG: SRPBCC family protein [Pseudorhodobacter sp.]